MNDKTTQDTEATLHCDVCMKEIPGSVAQSLEGPDYVYHFCGPACYSRWEREKHPEHNDEK